MSGIVNSVGSKSGVIGSTELTGGYEEGDFTVGNNTASWNFNNWFGMYRKVGNLLYYRWGGAKTIDTQTADSFTGLPFTVGETSQGVALTNKVNFQGRDYIVSYTVGTQTYFYLFYGAEDNTWGLSPSFASGDEVVVTGFYWL